MDKIKLENILDKLKVASKGDFIKIIYTLNIDEKKLLNEYIKAQNEKLEYNIENYRQNIEKYRNEIYNLRKNN